MELAFLGEDLQVVQGVARWGAGTHEGHVLLTGEGHGEMELEEEEYLFHVVWRVWEVWRVWGLKVIGNFEAGAGFVGEFVVAMDGGLREFFLELLDEAKHGFSLLWGSSILGLTILWQSTYVADAYTDGVVTCAVSTQLVFGAAYMDAAIAVDDE